MNITDEGLRLYELAAADIEVGDADRLELLCSAIFELTAEVRRLRDVNATLIAGVGHLAREAASS